MEKRDPFRDVANTSSSNEPQEPADDVGKQPEAAAASTSSANKENGFAKKAQQPSTDKSDLGCGSTKSRESRPRHSILKTFDPLCSDSPVKVVSEPKPEQRLRRQLIIEDSDESENSRLHSAEVSDDETSFVDACTTAEEPPSGAQIPESRSVELEESLLKFYTPDKDYTARKSSGSEPASTSEVTESEPVLVETPTSSSDQSHLQEEAPPSTSRDLSVTESEIVSAISKTLSSNSDVILTRTKFTITESELENINLVRERFSTDDRNANVRPRQESAADAIEANSLTSVSEIRNISPERSAVSIGSEAGNIEPAAEGQPINQDSAEREESSDDSQESRVSVIEKPVSECREEKHASTDPTKGKSEDSASSESAEEPLVLKETKSLENKSADEGTSGNVSEDKETSDETKKSYPESVLTKCRLIIEKVPDPAPQSEDKHTETESEESVEEESELESKAPSEKDKDPDPEPDPEPEPEEQQPENPEFSKDSGSPSGRQEKDSERGQKPDKQSKTQDSSEEHISKETCDKVQEPSEEKQISEERSEPDLEAKFEEKQELKQSLNDLEVSDVKPEPKPEVEQESDKSEQQPGPDPKGDFKEPEEPEKKTECTDQGASSEGKTSDVKPEPKPEVEQEFDKSEQQPGPDPEVDSKEPEEPEASEKKTESTEQGASTEEALDPSEFPAPTEQTEERVEEPDSASESQKPENAKGTDASAYIHQDEEHHLDSGVDSIEESYTKSPKSHTGDFEDGEKGDSQETENSSSPEEKLNETVAEPKLEIVDEAPSQDEQPQLVDEPAKALINLTDVPGEPKVDKVVANLTDSQKSDIKTSADINSFKAKMADLSEKLSEQQQENSDLKLQLNAIQQAKASLELEIRQKEEVIIKTQAEALKNEQTFKQEIKQLREKLKENSKLIEKDGSKELEDQLKEAKAREAKAVAELNQRTKDDLNYQKIMEEYENTIATRFADYQKLKEEHETATRHLANIELAFSDVHQKYERTKALLEGFKSNEEALNSALQASEKTCRQHEERYESLKAHAKGQIEKSNKEILMLRDKYELDINKLKAIIKRLEIKCSSLEVSLQQKTEECAALSALCDEVTGKKV